MIELTKAIKGGKRGDSAWTDYLMSERFGTRWKEEMSLERQEDFKLIMQIRDHLIVTKNVSRESKYRDTHHRR